VTYALFLDTEHEENVDTVLILVTIQQRIGLQWMLRADYRLVYYRRPRNRRRREPWLYCSAICSAARSVGRLAGWLVVFGQVL